MDYAQALKIVDENKPISGYLSINFGYSLSVILPYKEGLALLDTLSNAEKIDDYGSGSPVRPLTKDDVRVTIISRSDYRKRKMAALLNVTIDALEQIENPQPELVTTE